MSEFDQIKYQNNYIREKYDRIGLVVPKGRKEEFKAAASAAGMSLNEYLLSLINKGLTDLQS